MSEQFGSVTCKKSSDFHGGIRFQSRFTIRWELEDKSFLKIDIICLDDSLKYRIMAIKGLFTWSGGPRSSGVSFFCFHALGDTKQKKLTPLDRGPPLHVNRV